MRLPDTVMRPGRAKIDGEKKDRGVGTVGSIPDYDIMATAATLVKRRRVAIVY